LRRLVANIRQWICGGERQSLLRKKTNPESLSGLIQLNRSGWGEGGLKSN
jgi:hypothetical protein